MDRRAFYYGQVPTSADILLADRYAYEGQGLMFRDLLGETTQAGGFAITPNSPAALNVKVGPGRIYKFETLEATVFSRRIGLGGLDADTADDHKIMKQGVMRDTVILATPAPGTGGFSINYLVQATFAESDAAADPTNIYNAANPAIPTTENLSRERRNRATVSVKAGAAAATGTQVTPAPDAGYVALGVVTVANGQTTVVAGNITAAAGAPLVPNLSTALAVTAAFNALVKRDRLMLKKLTGTFLPTTQRTLTTSLVDIGPQGLAAATPAGKVRTAKVRISNVGIISANADLFLVDGGTNDGYRAKNFPIDPFGVTSSPDFERVVTLTAGQKLQARASAATTLVISIEWIEEDAGVFLPTTQQAVTNALADVVPYGTGAAVTPVGRVRNAWVRFTNSGAGSNGSADVWIVDTNVAANANDNWRSKAIPVDFNTTGSALDFEAPIVLTAGQKLQIKANANSLLSASVEFTEDAA